MSKKLLSVLIASLVVVRVLSFELDKHPNLKGGFVSSLTAKRYSSDATYVNCVKLEEAKKLYDDLIKEKVPLAEVIKITKEKEQGDLCYIHFKSTFVLDVNLENGKELAVSSITNLYNRMMNTRKKVFKGFSPYEFIYDASKKQFLYKNLEYLPAIVSKDNPTLTDESKSKLILDQIIKKYLDSNWHKYTSKFDSQFDRYKVNENGFSEPNKLEEIKTKEGGDSKSSSGNQDSKILRIEVKKGESEWKVFSELDSDKNEFSFNEDKEVFSVYLCQKIDSKVNECINLKENGSQNAFSWNFKVKNSYKVEVDVRPVDSLDRYLNLKLFKVFFVLSDISSMRILPSKTFHREVISKDKNFRSYFMIDKGRDDLLVFETENKKLEKVKISKKALFVKFDQQTEIEVFRIPYEPFESFFGIRYDFFKLTYNRLVDLENIFRDNNRLEYSYYQIRVPRGNSLILTNENETQPPIIYSHKTAKLYISSLIHTCDTKNMLLRNNTYEKKHVIFLGQEEKIYNCKVQLFKSNTVITDILKQNTGNFILYRDIYEDCIKFDDKSIITEYTPYRIEKPEKFEWNFNLEDTQDVNKDNICTIFFKDKDNNKFAKFKTKIFEFPAYKAYRVYLSIIFDDKTDNYIFSAYYFDEKYDVKPIVSIFNKDPVIFKTLPQSLNYNVVEKKKIKKNMITSFLDIKVNYLSSNEVVYAIDIDIKNECKSGINLFFQGDNLILQCTNTGTATKAGKTIRDFSKVSFSTGLDKIFSQTVKFVEKRLI